MKMTNIKILIFSCVGLLVLGLVTAVLLLTQPAEEEPEEVEAEDKSYLVFGDREVTDVASVEVKNSEAEFTLSAMTDEAGAAYYGVEGFTDVPLDTSTTKNTVSYISALTARQLVEENADDLEKYGLASPKAEVKVTYTDGTGFSFLVGDEAPTGSASYARRPGERDVFTVSTYQVSNFLFTAYDFINKLVVPEYDSENAPVVEKITITGREREDIVIETIPEPAEDETRYMMNSHQFTSPINVEIDGERGQSLIYGMFGLTAQSALWTGLDEVDYELAGLVDPQCVVTLKCDGVTYTLTVGDEVVQENEDGTQSVIGYYGTVSTAPDVLYLFSAGSLPWLDFSYDDVIARLFLTPYIYEVAELVVESAEDTLRFSMVGDAEEQTFYIDGEEAAADRYKTFYQFAIGAYGEQIYMEEDRGEFLARYTYSYFSERKTADVVEFYASPDDRKVIIYVNGAPMFKCREVYITRLVQNMAAVRDGSEIITSW